MRVCINYKQYLTTEKGKRSLSGQQSAQLWRINLEYYTHYKKVD